MNLLLFFALLMFIGIFTQVNLYINNKAIKASIHKIGDLDQRQATYVAASMQIFSLKIVANLVWLIGAAGAIAAW